ncbi:MAG: response regulator [Solirubrobacteraceae bacterium]
MSSDHIRAVVIDDHELFRGGMIQLLRDNHIDVVGDAALAAEGIELTKELMPDVVLMDLNMPGMSGIAATQRLATAAPLSRVLMLTVVADEESVVEALLAGACGYVVKDAAVAEILQGVRAVARGESMISPRVAGQLVARIRRPAEAEMEADAEHDAQAGSELTAREREILELIARGMDNVQIAAALFLSQHTVKNYVSSILVKLQVENRIQAAVRAVRRGLA